jgi:hypothetical protein
VPYAAPCQVSSTCHACLKRSLIEHVPKKIELGRLPSHRYAIMLICVPILPTLPIATVEMGITFVQEKKSATSLDG